MNDAQANQQNIGSDVATDNAMKAKRKKFLGFFMLILILAAILYAIWALFFNHSVSTIMRMSVQKLHRSPQW